MLFQILEQFLLQGQQKKSVCEESGQIVKTDIDKVLINTACLYKSVNINCNYLLNNLYTIRICNK